MSLFIQGQWQAGKGALLTSYNPADQEIIWQHPMSSFLQVNKACQMARSQFESWSQLKFEVRAEYCLRFAKIVEKKAVAFATLISQETGKPLWEAKTEVEAVIRKVAISIEAYKARTGNYQDQKQGLRIQHHPHGPLVVLGPFNFPAHLPNAHIIPALLAGNTILFKSSELTPAVGEFLIQCFQETDLPPGVIQYLPGNAQVGEILIKSPEIAGVLFTGGYNTGRKIHMQFAGRPEIILALEMGGNNPLLVWEIENIQAAIILILQSAFLTSGQRCTAARRLIIPNNEQGNLILEKLVTAISQLIIDRYDATPVPFMGPLITGEVVQHLLSQEKKWQQLKAVSILPLVHLSKKGLAFLRPGLIDITDMNPKEDLEIFGPLLSVIRCNNFSEAIAAANDTQYGLSAGIITENPKLATLFFDSVRAGVINWNKPLTGASSHLPFGGIKKSGNHHPSAFYAADYCAYPVASQYQDKLENVQALPGMKL